MGYSAAGNTLFARPHPAGWQEAFWLHRGWSGGDLFSIYYGIIAPGLYPGAADTPLREAPILLYEKLLNPAGSSAFGCASRAQVATSAEAFAWLYPQQATPWFAGFQNWQDILNKLPDSTRRAFEKAILNAIKNGPDT